MLDYLSTVFIDYTLLTRESEKERAQNVKSSLLMFSSVGCVVHPEKSILILSHQTTYFEFNINSENMTMVANDDKQNKKKSRGKLPKCRLRVRAW